MGMDTKIVVVVLLALFYPQNAQCEPQPWIGVLIQLIRIGGQAAIRFIPQLIRSAAPVVIRGAAVAGRGALAAGRVAATLTRTTVQVLSRGGARIAVPIGRNVMQVARAAVNFGRRGLNPLRKIARYMKKLNKRSHLSDALNVFDLPENEPTEVTETLVTDAQNILALVDDYEFLFNNATYELKDLEHLLKMKLVREMSNQEILDNIKSVSGFLWERIGEVREVVDAHDSSKALSQLVHNATGIDYEVAKCAARLVMLDGENQGLGCVKDIEKDNNDLVQKMKQLEEFANAAVDEGEDHFSQGNFEGLGDSFENLIDLTYSRAQYFSDAASFITKLQAGLSNCWSDVIESTLDVAIELSTIRVHCDDVVDEMKNAAQAA